MERRLAIILALFMVLAAISFLTLPPPVFGLSTILGVSVLGSSVLGSSVLGSSVLGSSVLGSSVLGSSVLGTTIVAAYGEAIGVSQLCVSLVVIGLLTCLELTRPSYAPTRRYIVEVRKSWVPISTLLVILVFVVAAMRVYGVLVG